MRKLILPSPPGFWRTREFEQPFKNDTMETVTLFVTRESFVLTPGSEIDICWEIKNNVSGWKIKWPQ